MSKNYRSGYSVVVYCVLMLRDHWNKWKQKHTSFWWKPLGTNHKLPHSSTLIVFLRENELFQGVGGSLSHLWKFWRGGGSSVPCKNGKSREVGGGGPKWNSLRGGGLDIFWNYTISQKLDSWSQCLTKARVAQWWEHLPPGLIWQAALTLCLPEATSCSPLLMIS